MTHAIVVGVDGSAESRAAADWAAQEAVCRSLPLRLVHAWLWQPVDVPVVQDRETQVQVAKSMLQQVEQDLTDRYPAALVSADVVGDTAVSALLDATRQAEMLVVGSRGHGALLGFLLGSCGLQVISAASCPVIAVRARADHDTPVREEVVVGQQGGSEDSHATLQFAFEAAAARGAVVRVVRAWSLPPVLAYSPASMQLVDSAGGLEPYEKAALDEALAPWRERYPDVPVFGHVEMGSAGQVLLSAAAGAALLVVGRRRRHSPVGSRIGSVAHAALHHARCPVAVIPHG
ncbi:universal stress protein [Streptomyces sp. AM8-1-1]|uniref:universal stress protein n=1 Tax=Streptomyces sp. AM8-1-1 TaxID=3075825 RepID=UPI0028C47E2D|nr:universal stress protein [Streptomyces sp. AM8-1-1]WNO70280.1 universal stress protein [Streptomyces sp. AM8-1-1]